MDAQGPTRNDVVRWLEAVSHDIDALHERLNPLLEEQRRLDARQVLLKELLSSFDAPAQPSADDGARGWAVTLQPAGSIGDFVRDRASEILREAGRPMHINDIHGEFQRRGLHIPGAGRPVNLTVHLRQGDAGIVSPERGMYALEEYAGSIPVQRKSTKRRKRARRRPAAKGA
jgi:hypothetical protein